MKDCVQVRCALIAAPEDVLSYRDRRSRRREINSIQKTTDKHFNTTRRRTVHLDEALGLELLFATADFHALVESFILRDLEVVLLRNFRSDKSVRISKVSHTDYAHDEEVCFIMMSCEPSTDEMAPLEMLDERLRSCEANQHCRIELAPHAGSWGTVLDTPRRWSIDRSHRDFSLFECADDGREWFPHFSGEAESCDELLERRQRSWEKQHGVYEPKIASTMWSVDLRASSKSSMKGTSRSSNCLASR